MELQFCEHYKQVGPFDEWSCTAEDPGAADAQESYLAGNKVGIVEGLEMAALYHEGLANYQVESAIWDVNGNPCNGPAIYVASQRKHAAYIRAMK